MLFVIRDEQDSCLGRVQCAGVNIPDSDGVTSEGDGVGIVVGGVGGLGVLDLNVLSLRVL